LKEGHVIWYTGVSGAGKTTLANLLHNDFKKYNINHQVLDGDILRKFFEDDMGYGEKDRISNLKRIAFASKLLSDNGITVIVAAVASLGREFLRENLKNYIQIYVSAPMETVIRRDPKGMYKRFQNGETNQVVGLDIPYIEPKDPDVIVHTEKEDVYESHHKILNYLKSKDLF
tara:strand:+ start:1171 stop:1689 length:519 start_codon:yes stop_codon:yes gene_type:complete